MLDVRTWVCSACGVTHDRDVNAARNMLSAGRSPRPFAGTSHRFQLRRRARHPVDARQGSAR
ncbi:MAG TPA: zinc ribbon domain-containing protein [Steroidobacteraceae bacterium]|nr:zinc ribbon domain-containing protein [Steroidobacteraceae bacterium]